MCRGFDPHQTHNKKKPRRGLFLVVGKDRTRCREATKVTVKAKDYIVKYLNQYNGAGIRT